MHESRLDGKKILQYPKEISVAREKRHAKA